MSINKTTYRAAQFIYGSWVMLGAKRGTDTYTYEIEKKQKYESTNHMYSEQMLYAIAGGISYSIPLLFPIFMFKEMKRLEVNIRGLKIVDEKHYKCWWGDTFSYVNKKLHMNILDDSH